MTGSRASLSRLTVTGRRVTVPAAMVLYHSNRPLPASAGAMPRLSVTLLNFLRPGLLARAELLVGAAAILHDLGLHGEAANLGKARWCSGSRPSFTSKCRVVRGYMIRCSFCYSDRRLWLKRKMTNSAGLAGAMATSVMTNPRSMSVSVIVWPRPTRTR